MFFQAKKALYLSLCGLLGALVFLVAERSLFLIYLVWLYWDFEAFSFGLSWVEIWGIDLMVISTGLFLGYWYGIWLGLYWFDFVYVTNKNRGVLKHFGEHLNWKYLLPGLRKTPRAGIDYADWQVDDLLDKPVKVTRIKPKVRALKTREAAPKPSRSRKKIV